MTTLKENFRFLMMMIMIDSFSSVQQHLRVFKAWGPPQGGPWPPPRFYSGGGGSNAFGPPPDFRKNSVMYTINVQCFSLKKQWNAYIIVYILLKNF